MKTILTIEIRLTRFTIPMLQIVDYMGQIALDYVVLHLSNMWSSVSHMCLFHLTQ